MISKVFVAASLLGTLSLAAHAEPITYTESGYVSGYVGSQTFSNSLLTITGTGDTSNVRYEDLMFLNPVHATATIAGIGSFTLDNSVEAGDAPAGNLGFNAPQVVGFLDVGSLYFGGPPDESFLFDNIADQPYDLRSSFGPSTGGAVLEGNVVYNTSAGQLRLTAANSDATFLATTTTATPEPYPLALLATGLLGLTGALRKRYS